MSPSASERQNEGPMWDSACLVDPTGNETRSVYYREEPSTPDPSPFENWSDDSPDEKLFGVPPGISTPAKEEAAEEEDIPVEPEPAVAPEPVVEPAPAPEPMELEVESPPQHSAASRCSQAIVSVQNHLTTRPTV